MKHVSPRFPNHEFVFKRINVILGANGSGKSKLLEELKKAGVDQKGTNQRRKVIYIEGGRTMVIKDVVQPEGPQVGNYMTMEGAEKHYEQKRDKKLAGRVLDALIVLDKRDAEIKAQHSDTVEKWIASGSPGKCPTRPLPPLERLFALFTEIFPGIALSYSQKNKTLVAQQKGQEYGPSHFSDGEKQVFSILADLIELADDQTLIIADEPELNLHPDLAARLWTLIENEFPDKTFIYATHSISFALRRNVEKVYVLSSNADHLEEFTGLESLPRSEVSTFLGAIPGFLTANRVLVTEGHEKSFDSIFYRWLLSDTEVEIYPAGGCTEVLPIINKSGLWDKITSKIGMLGVIDMDFRSEEYLKSLISTSVKGLTLHEAESYLCIPAIITAVATRIGSMDMPLTSSIVEDRILEMLNRDKLVVAAKRLFFEKNLKLGISVTKKLLAASKTRDEMLSAIKDAASDERTKAIEFTSESKLESDFDAVLATIQTAIDRKDIMAALQFLPGKELLNELSPLAGCKNGDALMRSLRTNFKPGDFPQTRDLAEALAFPSV